MFRLKSVKLIVAVCLLLSALPCVGKIYYSKNEAMELAFGKDATVEMLSLFPTADELAQIEKMARVKMESSLYTFYVGKKGDQVIAYAAIESHTVRTKPETLLVVLTPEGKISAVHTLAFHEPPEYQPPQRWYQQLYQKELERLSFSADIQGMTGATLSTRSALNISRKVMAIYQILVKNKQN
ncbi:FMN-binding protein [Methylomarinum sp. Ch1-1]|uniref:FMN-binding protein n=1 Tax=Methylomarinum roseum TaxID=3067653 RepID=A0AAU7NYP7_9GAMM|nr:FMN-binding protein [Methylomarinum sp. Ch1-1]MDP4521819.1 FMN-binding protein [Methylomarinum sp. Ch1-1]